MVINRAIQHTTPKKSVGSENQRVLKPNRGKVGTFLGTTFVFPGKRVASEAEGCGFGGAQSHAHLLFAYWITARLGREWRALGERGEVPRLLRALKVIRVGTLCITGFESKRLLTRVPDELNPLPDDLVAEQR